MLQDPVDNTFKLYHKCCQSTIGTANQMDIYVDVITERNKNPGPVYFEFPIPANITDNVFSICSFEVLNIGANLPCVGNKTVQASANLTTYVHL